MKLSTPVVSSRTDGTRWVSGSARVAGATRAQSPTYIHPAMPYTAGPRQSRRQHCVIVRSGLPGWRA